MFCYIPPGTTGIVLKYLKTHIRTVALHACMYSTAVSQAFEQDILQHLHPADLFCVPCLVSLVYTQGTTQLLKC